MELAVRVSASPREVVPLAVGAGIWKLRRSVRGTACQTEESKVITDT
jgi:hypothetical protein